MGGDTNMYKTTTNQSPRKKVTKLNAAKTLGLRKSKDYSQL